MGPAGRQHNVTACRQPFKPGIAVDLQHAPEVLEVGGGPLRFAVGAVEEDGCRRIRSGPGTVIARIDPEPPGPGPAAARIQHWDRRVVGEQLGRREDMVC